MKHLLTCSVLLSVGISAASDSPKKKPRFRSGSRIVHASSSAVPVSDLPTPTPVSSPTSERLHEIGKKICNLRDQNPYSLSLSSIPRSKSNPEQLGGPLLLSEEYAEALSVSESPRGPLSPRALVRVASLSSCQKVLSEKDQAKAEYIKKITPAETRIFDAVGSKDLEFIKTQPHLMEVLTHLSGEEIARWFRAYLRVVIPRLEKKCAVLQEENAMLRKKLALLALHGQGEHLSYAASSSCEAATLDGDTSAEIAALIEQEQKDDLSPRKISLYSSPAMLRESIHAHLQEARVECDHLTGTPIRFDVQPVKHPSA